MRSDKPVLPDDTLLGDRFDREYGLPDLLPLKELNLILSPLEGGCQVEILHCNGSTYFWHDTEKSLADDQWIQSVIENNALNASFSDHWLAGKGVLGLQHERENIGFLVIAAREENGPIQNCLKQLGNLLIITLNRIIQLNCQIQMTSNLQSQVVEDSYSQLQHKAERLAQSEQKYRQLAESLEQQVTRKTATLKQAMSTMAQQEKMAAVGQLAAGVAHEINNPMGFIISNLNALREHCQNLNSFFQAYRVVVEHKNQLAASNNTFHWQALYRKHEIEYLLSDIDAIVAESLEGAQRIKKIVTDLKEFSKPGLHNAVQVDINQLLQTLLNVSKAHIGDHIQLTTDFAPLPKICCIPQQINLALLNILLNAIQSINGRGKLSISTRPIKDQVEVVIRDYGCGIASKDLPKIFDPFFTTREIGKGKGLGLTFAYDVVQKHQGSITARSEVTKGTTFTIRIPAITP